MIADLVERLNTFYTFHPERRYLKTKKRIYRNIISDAYLIIYRTTDERVEVLDILHSASSIQKIKTTRKIKI